MKFLIVLIVLLSVLALLLAPAFIPPSTNPSHRNPEMYAVKELAIVIISYRYENGKYPETKSDIIEFAKPEGPLMWEKIKLEWSYFRPVNDSSSEIIVQADTGSKRYVAFLDGHVEAVDNK